MRLFLGFTFFVLTFTLTFAQVKVMTYNIRYDTPKDGVNQWDSRKQKVIDLLKKYDPDLLGVQEALHNQLQDIQSGLTGYEFVGAGRDDGKQKGEYSAIFYKKDRFDVLEQNTFWLSETPDVPGSKNWDAAITRVASWAKLKDKKTGREFLFVNTHFDHIGKEARAQSAVLLKSKVEALAGKLPAIVTGDFNCTRSETPYQTMISNSGLVLVDPVPANQPSTCCGFSVDQPSPRAIDYIFHTAGWTSGQYISIRDNDGTYFPSDHLPVMVTLDFGK